MGSVLVGSVDVRLKGCFSIGELCGEKMLGIVQECREGIGIIQFIELFQELEDRRTLGDCEV